MNKHINGGRRDIFLTEDFQLIYVEGMKEIKIIIKTL